MLALGKLLVIDNGPTSTKLRRGDPHGIGDLFLGETGVLEIQISLVEVLVLVRVLARSIRPPSGTALDADVGQRVGLVFHQHDHDVAFPENIITTAPIPRHAAC